MWRRKQISVKHGTRREFQAEQSEKTLDLFVFPVSLISLISLVCFVGQTEKRTLHTYRPPFSSELTRFHWNLKLLTDVLFFFVVNVIDIEMINDQGL